MDKRRIAFDDEDSQDDMIEGSDQELSLSPDDGTGPVTSHANSSDVKPSNSDMSSQRKGI